VISARPVSRAVSVASAAVAQSAKAAANRSDYSAAPNFDAARF
jgi:hypothetical protein